MVTFTQNDVQKYTQIKKCDNYRIIHQLVQIRRIELLRREAQDSKSCVSTSSTISACFCIIK